MAIPSDCTFICNGRSPEGRDDCPFFIRDSLLEKVYTSGPAWKFDDLHFLTRALQEPLGIYEDLNRPGYDEACCHYFCPNDQQRDMFFVVYTESCSGGLIVIDYGWRPEDLAALGNPTGWQHFKKGKVWTKT